MAVGRIIASVAGLGVVGASYLGVAGQDNSVRDETGSVVEAGEVGAFRVRLGDCIQDTAGEVIESVEAVPCDRPHDLEVYHAFNLTGTTFPAEEDLMTDVGDGCYAAFAGFVGATYEESTLDFGAMWPTAESWAQFDDREVLCTVYALDETPLIGTARNSRL